MVNEADSKYKGKGKKIFIVLSGMILISIIYAASYFLGKALIFKDKYASGSLKSKTTSVYKNTEVDIQKDKAVKLKSVQQLGNDSTANKDADDKKSLVALDQAEKPLKIQVNLSKQRVYVYDAKNKTVEDFICSSGLNGYDTPKGEYTIKERGYSFYSEKYKEGAYYWVQFMGNYLFHSVPFDKNQVIETDEIQKLGTKASHGCVRLSIKDAKWIYDNIPRGTMVTIK
ncbi:L,D-transpeptidase [Clostridium neuense]|uniref:L,D-transpeptidase n=1 Tax=Clostridium neuense TaxID=1728934 RepID=A0ABW8TF82_9CLOT